MNLYNYRFVLYVCFRYYLLITAQANFVKIGGMSMKLSCNKMKRLLVKKNMSLAELRNAANIVPNIMTKLR